MLTQTPHPPSMYTRAGLSSTGAALSCKKLPIRNSLIQKWSLTCLRGSHLTLNMDIIHLLISPPNLFLLLALLFQMAPHSPSCSISTPAHRPQGLVLLTSPTSLPSPLICYRLTTLAFFLFLRSTKLCSSLQPRTLYKHSLISKSTSYYSHLRSSGNFTWTPDLRQLPGYFLSHCLTLITGTDLFPPQNRCQLV